MTQALGRHSRRPIAIGLIGLIGVALVVVATVEFRAHPAATPATPTPTPSLYTGLDSTLPNEPGADPYWYLTGVAVGDTFVMATAGGHQIWYGDGKSWAEADTSMLQGMVIQQLVTYGGGVMAVGGPGASYAPGLEVATSSDGRQWTRLQIADPSVFDDVSMLDAVSGPAGVVIWAGSQTWLSDDGVHWQAGDALSPDWSSSMSVYGGPKGYEAVGGPATVDSSGGVPSFAAGSSDGLHWSTPPWRLPSDVGVDVVPLPEGFLALAAPGTEAHDFDSISSGATGWRRLGNRLPFNRDFGFNLASDGRRAVVTTTEGIWQSTDGQHWTELANMSTTGLNTPWFIVIGKAGIVSSNNTRGSDPQRTLVFIPAPEN